jgi:hypothetical protein
VFQPSSRQAVLVRSGDVLTGHVGLCKSELTTRARASVTLELVFGSARQQQAALVQQYICKPKDAASLRQHVAVALGDMEQAAQVFGDNWYIFCDFFAAGVIVCVRMLTLVFSAGEMFMCLVIEIAN